MAELVSSCKNVELELKKVFENDEECSNYLQWGRTSFFLGKYKFEKSNEENKKDKIIVDKLFYLKRITDWTDSPVINQNSNEYMDNCGRISHEPSTFEHTGNFTINQININSELHKELMQLSLLCNKELCDVKNWILIMEFKRKCNDQESLICRIIYNINFMPQGLNKNDNSYSCTINYSVEPRPFSTFIEFEKKEDEN